jgi:hypothetical protein
MVIQPPKDKIRSKKIPEERMADTTIEIVLFLVKFKKIGSGEILFLRSNLPVDKAGFYCHPGLFSCRKNL